MNTLHVEFSGHMQKGKKEGKGGFLYKDTGDFYHGSWQNDNRYGFGIIFYGPNSIQGTIFGHADNKN